MTFKSAHHNTILTVLESLDSDVLREGFAYFGGGTLITLDFGEYRWSKDIDFICPVSSSGYRHLRTVRYIDDSVESRDLIDLAVLWLQSSIPQKAVDKAEKAYEVIRPLKVAVQRFQERVDYRERCFSGLRIDDSQIPRIIDGIDLLAGDLGLASTERTFKEQHDIFTDAEA